MKIIWFILLLATTLTAFSAADSKRIIGQDYLAAQQPNFSSGYGGKYLAKNSAVGALDSTFGTDTNRIRNLLRYESPLYFRIHLINTVCIRNQNCGAYEIGRGYSIGSFNDAVRAKSSKILNYLSARVKFYCALQKEFPKTTFIISPALEHNLSREGARVLIDKTLELCPNVMVSNNPMTAVIGERYRGALLEGHGVDPGSVDISSLDGIDGTDVDIRGWMSRTENNFITYFWSRGYNCRHQGSFEDPRNRDSCTSKELIEGFNHITDIRIAPKPQFSCSFREFKAPNIYKPLAADHGAADTRANLPVLIMPGSKSSVTLIAVNGRAIGKLAYYGAYNKTQNRYYSGYAGGSHVSGWSFEKRAKKEGSNYVWLKLDNRCYGPIIPSFRQGSYR